MLNCSICDILFVPSAAQRWSAAKGKNVICGAKCRRVLNSVTASHTNSIYASERMKRSNPMSQPKSVSKMRRTLKRIGHRPSVCGGNGTGLTPAEQALSSATGLLPYNVNTHGGLKDGYPTHYKLDLAHVEHKLGIEVDGGSHQMLSRQAQDRKKEEYLKARGWTILRFTNKQALEETDKCCEIIKSKLWTLFTAIM